MTDERKVDVSADDDLFDDQIDDAIWEAASYGEGQITAVSLRRELTLLGLQIVSKAYHDSLASARDEAVRKAALFDKEGWQDIDAIKAQRDAALAELAKAEAINECHCTNVEALTFERDAAEAELAEARAKIVILQATCDMWAGIAERHGWPETPMAGTVYGA